MLRIKLKTVPRMKTHKPIKTRCYISKQKKTKSILNLISVVTKSNKVGFIASLDHRHGGLELLIHKFHTNLIDVFESHEDFGVG